MAKEARTKRRRRRPFARRIMLLFLVVGVLPLAGVGAVSVDRLNRRARDQAYANLRETAKFAALTVSDRLDAAAVRLVETARVLEADPAAAPDGEPWWGRMLADTFADAAYFPPEGPGRVLLGKPVARPTLTREDQRALTVGKTALLRTPGEAGRREVWMAQRVGEDLANPSILVARVRPDWLWTVERMMPGEAGLCVLDDDGALFCTLANPVRVARRVAAEAPTSDIGRLVLAGDSEPFLASYWSLFLAARFGASSWVVVVGEPQDKVVTAGVRVARTYGLAVAAIVLVATFLVLHRVRIRLAPLKRLRDATRTIAEGDFGERVEVMSGDELEDLGDGFNRMAERLDRQFKGLAIRAEIDRLILSSLDAGHIVETVLHRLHELVPCDAVGVLALTGQEAGNAQLSVFVPSLDLRPRDELVHLTDAEIAHLLAHPDGMALSGSETDAAFLETLRSYGARHFEIFPVAHKDELAAAIILGHKTPDTTTADDVREMREFTDRVAVALANAAWEEKLYYQAHYDSLTGVPNRALLRDRLEGSMVRAKRAGTSVAVLFLDLDRFKAINDSLAHTGGDQLLKRTADVLSGSVREGDTVVRFGGDEFVVLLPDLAPGEAGTRTVVEVAERILAGTRDPFQLSGHRVEVTASIGVAMYPRDADGFDDLLRNADAAMYHAKASGRGEYRFYAPDLNAAAAERLSLEHELRDALEGDQFRILYQPQVDAETGRIVGAEALVRWEHPRKGMVSPIIFIPVAEETGLILPLGEWVLHTAAAQAKAWADADLPPLRMCVNASPVQVGADGFVAMVRRALARTGLAPGRLEVEVTEGAIMSDTERNVATLSELRAMGVRVSVDDFGTGYSSLSYLQRFPLNTLKVDQSFTRDMMENPDSASIAAAVVALGHSLGLTVIAEGVETVAQQARLAEWGCEELQGYLFGRPMPAEDFAQLLEATPTAALRP